MRITRAGAFTVAGILLALCLGLAAASGLRPFLVALGLVVAIVVYDAVAKRTAVGPAVMASCIPERDRNPPVTASGTSPAALRTERA